MGGPTIGRVWLRGACVLDGDGKGTFARNPLRPELSYRDADGGNFVHERRQNIGDEGPSSIPPTLLQMGATLDTGLSPPDGKGEGAATWINLVVGDERSNPGVGMRAPTHRGAARALGADRPGRRAPLLAR